MLGTNGLIVTEGCVHTVWALGPVSVFAGAMLACPSWCSTTSEKPVEHLHKLLHMNAALTPPCMVPVTPEAAWLVMRWMSSPIWLLYSAILVPRVSERGYGTVFLHCIAWMYLLPSVLQVLPTSYCKTTFTELEAMYKFPAEGQFYHLYATHSDVGSSCDLDSESS